MECELLPNFGNKLRTGQNVDRKFDGMSAGKLEDILTEAENLLDEARESLGLK